MRYFVCFFTKNSNKNKNYSNDNGDGDDKHIGEIMSMPSISASAKLQRAH